MKWYVVSMCLVLLWNTWFFDKAMVELLSQKMVLGSCLFYEMSFNILCIQISWHATPVTVTYSDSVENKVRMGCFFKSHDKKLVPKWNLYPNVILLSFMFPQLSLQVYPISLKLYEVEYINKRSFVPLTYLKILLTTCQWDSFSDSMSIEIRLSLYIMFVHVTVKHIRLPTILLINIGSTVDPSSSLLNFKPDITGVGDVLQLDILNLFKTTHAYFDCDIKIPLSDA